MSKIIYHNVLIYNQYKTSYLERFDYRKEDHDHNNFNNYNTNSININTNYLYKKIIYVHQQKKILYLLDGDNISNNICDFNNFVENKLSKFDMFEYDNFDSVEYKYLLYYYCLVNDIDNVQKIFQHVTNYDLETLLIYLYFYTFHLDRKI